MSRVLLAALAFACVSLPAMAAGEVGMVGDTAVVAHGARTSSPSSNLFKKVIISVLVAVLTALVARLGPIARMLTTEALIQATVNKWVD